MASSLQVLFLLTMTITFSPANFPSREYHESIPMNAHLQPISADPAPQTDVRPCTTLQSLYESSSTAFRACQGQALNCVLHPCRNRAVMMEKKSG